MSVSTEMMNTPFPEMVRLLGIGIAEAQYQLDLVSLKIARMMAGYAPPDETDEEPSLFEEDDSKPDRDLLVKLGDGHEYSLLELGFTPTFYQFVDTLIELKLSISISRETNYSRSKKTVKASAAGGWFGFGGGATMRASSVSSSYSSKYQYSAEGSSLLRTKLVPVPPPAVLEERIRAMIAASDKAASGSGGT
ncbi:hypothetical protein C8J27_10495 [Rhodobacter aestuarii]|uniref:Uncharacterized protein n=1 Tax=Rhodobacter aestuarii TaxID=453582 RepID=A0A1N7L0K0_9RHOB|nr:hypothetical protein [Rhodobacter aestuarii]PTV95459.1 hypothetical protein C8J27_10495 [Rhodobacter aestuarii]SIS67389.1 hypothetical protein SAMN05421580_103159 [Rhodobacter aestuarii]